MIRRRKPLSVYEHARRLMASVSKKAHDAQRVAHVNERAVGGDPWGASFYERGELKVADDEWDDELPRLSVNKLDSLSGTWVSLLTSNRLAAKAEAATDEPEDHYRAHVAQAVIEYWSREVSTATKFLEVVRLAFHHGTAAAKVIYDPSDKTVPLSAVSIFDYVRDPTPNHKDARWVIFSEFISEEEALDLFDMADIKREPSLKTYKAANGEEQKGVERLEVWQLPCRDYPKGLQATIVDGEVLEEMDYPYVFQDDSGEPQYLLPLVEMKVREVRKSPYGRTPLTDVIPLQRSYNETYAKIQDWIRRIKPHLVLPKEVADIFDPATSSSIAYPQSAAANGAPNISWISPPPPPGDLYQHLQLTEAQILSTLGINEITSGAKTRSVSGIAIENMRQLDADKNADAARSYENLVLEVYRLALLLIGRYYDAPRKVKISGDSRAAVISFSGADIQGVDIKLETGSEVDHLEDSKEAKTVQRRQAGLVSDREWRAVLDKPGNGLSKKAAEKLIQDYLQDLDVDLTAGDIKPAILEATIAKHKALALADGRRTDWVKLEALHRYVRDLEEEPDPLPEDDEVPPNPRAQPPEPPRPAWEQRPN